MKKQGRGLDKYISLREGLRTHNVFTKDQCFYLNYHKFLIKIICLGCVLESSR